MMIRAARVRPADRIPTESDKTPSAQVQSFPAPTGGMVSAASMAGGVVVMENFWPTPRGIEPRGGSREKCTIAGPVRALFEYRKGETFFAADDSAIYAFDHNSTGPLVAAVTGRTSGAVSTYETQNSGGSFLTVVNGVDPMLVFDGTTWQAVTATSSPHAITGIGTSKLSFVWGHRNRLFFIEAGTMSAWYLGVNSVSGAATELPLAGTFRKGGSLMMGATFSSDSGAGMDDRCVFVTDAGEVAIYSGSNPGDVNNWRLDGVYDLADVAGRKSVISLGGDLVFATREGLFPLTGVISRDPAEMRALSYANAIAPNWDAEVGDWRLTKWQNMLVAVPLLTGGAIYACNLENNAWTKITGWDVSEIAGLGGLLYYGNAAGQIVQGWTGGDDMGDPFVCRATLPFSALSGPATTKTAHMMQAIWKVRGNVTPKLSVAVDYKPGFPTAPAVSAGVSGDEGIWDAATWDVSEWGREDGDYRIASGWRSVAGTGTSLAPQVQITCGSVVRISANLERIDLTYASAGVGM